MFNDKKLMLSITGLLLLVLSTYPIFVEIYRKAAFDTAPRDDYAPYLLYLLGQGGKIPGAPFAYRILSVAIAIPFYFLLPTYAFTNLQNIDPAYLRATQALSFSSYLWLILTPAVIYTIARRKYNAMPSASLIIALSTFFLSGFIQSTGVDPFGIFIISLLVLYLDKPVIYVPLIVMSIGINEKIPIIFTSILTFRMIVSLIRRRPFSFFAQLIFSYVAIVGYLSVIFFVDLPRTKALIDPALFFINLQSSLMYIFSIKGFIRNIIPILILLVMVALAVKYRKQNGFEVSDISGLIVLLIVSLLVNVKYNVGRIIMYCYPLYLPALSAFIKDLTGVLSQKDKGSL